MIRHTLFKHLPALIFVALLTTAGALIYLVSTEDGLRQLYTLTRRLTPLDIEIGEIHGRLIGPVAVENVQWRTGKLIITAQRLEIDWKPAALLERNLHVLHIAARDLRIEQRVPSTDEPITLPNLHLPIVLHIDEAKLEGFRFIRYAAATPFILDRARARIHTAGQQIYVDRLEVAAPLFDLHGEGQVMPHDAYPVVARLKWTLHLPEQPRFDGVANISGTIEDRLLIAQRLTAPVVARLQGTVWSPLSPHTLRWRALASAAPFELRRLASSWPDWRAGGRIQAEGTLHTAAARGELGAMLDTNALNARFNVRYDARASGTLTLQQLELTSPGTPATVSLQGHVAGLTRRPRAALEGTWTTLQWPLTGTPRVASPAGTFTFSGTPNDYRLALNTDLAGPGLPASRWSVSGRGGLRQFTGEDIQVATMDGTVRGTSHIDWGHGIAWQLDAEANALDPSRQWPMWPGHIGFTLRAEGTAGKDGPVVTADLANLHGDLRQQPISGDAALALSGDAYDLSRLNLHWGDNTLSGAGRLTQDWDMDWRIEAGNLAQITPDVSGSVRGAAHLTGPRDHPNIALSVGAHDLAYGAYTLAESGLAAAIDLNTTLPSTFDFEGRGLTRNGHTVDHVHVTANGTLADHMIDLTTSVPGASAKLGFAGAFADRAWAGTLARGGIATDIAGKWTLAAPSTLNLSSEEANVQAICLQQAPANLCLQGTWARNQGWNAIIKGRGVPVTLFGAYMPTGIHAEGGFDIDATAASTNGPITGTLTVAATPGAITRVASADEEELHLEHRDGRIEARLDNHALTASASISLSNEGTVTGGVGTHITVPRSELPVPFNSSDMGPEPPFSARLLAEIQDVTILPLIVPELEAAHGRISADLRAEGSLAQPRITGDINMTQFSARILPLGITLHDGELRISGAKQNYFELNGQITSGSGSLHIKGETHYDLLHLSQWATKLSLKGENFEVADTPEVAALASPDLQITLAPKRVEITGELTIPKAEIRLHDLTSAQRPSDDVVIMDSPEGTAATPAWDVYSQVRLRLADNVHFQGLGLKAKLTGEMVVSDTPQQPTTARGELRVVDATYRAYGQNLDVQRGRLLFYGGPIDNPGVDVRAVRHIDAVTAGILVRGSLKNPALTLYSDPSMSEADTLSYLLLGRPINQASGQEGARLYGAASALGLAGGEALAGEIGQLFGVEDVHIESGGEYGAAALVIRHYLSPKLYVSYGVGLFERLNIVLLRYQISKHWAAEAQSSSTGGGADLLYTIETHPE